MLNINLYDLWSVCLYPFKYPHSYSQEKGKGSQDRHSLTILLFSKHCCFFKITVEEKQKSETAALFASQHLWLFKEATHQSAFSYWSALIYELFIILTVYLRCQGSANTLNALSKVLGGKKKDKGDSPSLNESLLVLLGVPISFKLAAKINLVLKDYKKVFHPNISKQCVHLTFTNLCFRAESCRILSPSLSVSGHRDGSVWYWNTEEEFLTCAVWKTPNLARTKHLLVPLELNTPLPFKTREIHLISNHRNQYRSML